MATVCCLCKSGDVNRDVWTLDLSGIPKENRRHVTHDGQTLHVRVEFQQECLVFATRVIPDVFAIAFSCKDECGFVPARYLLTDRRVIRGRSSLLPNGSAVNVEHGLDRAFGLVVVVFAVVGLRQNPQCVWNHVREILPRDSVGLSLIHI